MKMNALPTKQEMLDVFKTTTGFDMTDFLSEEGKASLADESTSVLEFLKDITTVMGVIGEAKQAGAKTIDEVIAWAEGEANKMDELEKQKEEEMIKRIGNIIGSDIPQFNEVDIGIPGMKAYAVQFGDAHDDSTNVVVHEDEKMYCVLKSAFFDNNWNMIEAGLTKEQAIKSMQTNKANEPMHLFKVMLEIA